MTVNVTKEAGVGPEKAVDEGELALINAQSKKTLTAEEVYTFSVRLCDNEIDREGERFPEATLRELEGLFVGKSGIFDHNWSAGGQSARIYRTELVREENVRTGAGDGYCYLKGYAYMVRTPSNADLIAEIDGGIKREVSVGCSVKRSVCSVCGQEIDGCRHVKGRTYNGKLCWAELLGATDAYEWSFVAVPAQPKAGVIKSLREGVREMELKTFLADRPEYLEQLETLEREAVAGRRYLGTLRDEVVRLAALVQPEVDGGVMKGIVGKMDEAELAELKRAYRKRVDEQWPNGAQLTYRGEKRGCGNEDGAFLV